MGSFTKRALPRTCRLEQSQRLASLEHAYFCYTMTTAFNSKGLLLQKPLSQLRNEQVGAAILPVFRESWSSLGVLAHVATVAAQCGVLDAIVAAPRLQQNESEKVEQLVAQFTEKPMVVMCNQPTRQPSIRVSAVAAQRMQKGRGDPKRTLRLITPLRTMVRQLLQCQMLGPLTVVKTPTTGSKTPRLQRSVLVGSVS